MSTHRLLARGPHLLLLLIAWLPCMAARATAVDWQLELHLNPDLLRSWDIDWRFRDDRLDAVHNARFPGYLSLRLAATPAGKDGSARLALPLRLTRGARTLTLDDLHVDLLRAQEAVVLRAADGEALLLGEMPHRHDDPLGLNWRLMNLRVLPGLARRLGVPGLSEQLLGGLDLIAPGQPTDKGQRDCRATVQWPSPAHPADLALAEMSAVFALRCDGCTASSQFGRVALAPNAELVNVGAADIPWRPKFMPPSPPYGNDQHPYLVWSLYRIDADGRLLQIAASGLKHAFFAQNSQCDCAGDTVLFRGCADLYSAFTNDIGTVLGPRFEVAPRGALWGRCGSLYDRDCDGTQDVGAGVAGGYAERAVASEADLLASLNPGAEYWVEAWYVVRDDSVLDNNLAHRRVSPQKTSAAWSFPTNGATQAGPLIERWIARGTADNDRHALRIDDRDGRIQLGVRSSPLGDGRYRYDYAVMNLDYSDSRIEGNAPNLRLTEQHGVQGLAFELPADAVDSIDWRDADTDTGNDWVRTAAATLELRAASDAGLGWGRLGALRLVTSQPPRFGQLRLLLGEGHELRVTTIVPAAADHLFADGFEPR